MTFEAPASSVEVGVGINQGGMIPRFLDLVDLDFFLVAIPYTLMEARGSGRRSFHVARSGMWESSSEPFSVPEFWSREPSRVPSITMRTPHPRIWRKFAAWKLCARVMESRCRRRPLQFPFGHPCVASVIPGAFQPEHVEQNIAHFQHDIPSDLWEELKAENLIRPDAPTP